MGSVSAYSTASGKRYRVRYRKPDHSQTDKRGFTTKKEAELFLATVEIGKATGSYIDPLHARITVEALGQAWLNRQGHLKASTRRTVLSAWNNHVQGRWGPVEVRAVRHTDVAEWVTELSLKKAPRL